MRHRTFVLVASVALAALAAFMWWRQRDEQRIRRTLDALVTEVQKAGPEGAIAAAARARSIADRFDEDPEIDLDEMPVAAAHRTELASIVFRARAAVSRLEVKLYDTTVEVDRSAGTARVQTTARATATLEGSGGDTRTQELAFEWVRTPDGWRIASVRTVRAIRRL